MISFPLKTYKTRLIVLFSIFSCIVAFINQYPLIYPDTGTYMYSGFTNRLFPDRPFFYGFFMRHTSLAVSPFLIVFAQGLLICYILYITLGIFFKDNNKNKFFIFIMTFLILTTGFSYNVSILIPDIFSSIVILSFINLIFNNNLSKLEKILIPIIFIFSICTHFSNIAIIGILLFLIGCFIIVRKIYKKSIYINLKKTLYVSIFFLSTLIIIPSVNYLVGEKFIISGGNHVFIMNHFIETGILEEYLKDECKKTDYKICKYKDELGWNFIWSETSPLKKTGGWEGNEIEYNAIIKDIITTPKYFILIVRKSIVYTFKQFFKYDVTISPSQLNADAFGQISWHFSDTKREYITSLQNESKLDVRPINIIQNIVVIVSVIFLFVLIINRNLLNKLSRSLKWIILIILTHNFISCFICSNLSTICPRFQNRIIWMLPLFAAISFFDLYGGKIKSILKRL